MFYTLASMLLGGLLPNESIISTPLSTGNKIIQFTINLGRHDLLGEEESKERLNTVQPESKIILLDLYIYSWRTT